MCNRVDTKRMFDLVEQMSFQPLDSRTQRERINVSRSGTMGVRRPPTRRHTPAPAAALSSSPVYGHVTVTSEPELDSDADLLMLNSSPELPMTNSSVVNKHHVSIKTISPKIKVGFPMEIQQELQTKFRSSSSIYTPEVSEDVEEEECYNNRWFSDRLSKSVESQSSFMTGKENGFASSTGDESSDGTSTFYSQPKSRFQAFLNSENSRALSSNIISRVSNFKSELESAVNVKGSGFKVTSKEENPKRASLENTPSWGLLRNMAHKESSGLIKTGFEHLASHAVANTSSGTSTTEQHSNDDVFHAAKNQPSPLFSKKTVITLSSDDTANPHSQKDCLYADDSLESNLDSLHKTGPEFTDRLSAFHNDKNKPSSEKSFGFSKRSQELMKLLEESSEILTKTPFKPLHKDSTAHPMEKHSIKGESEKPYWENHQLAFLNDSLNRILANDGAQNNGDSPLNALDGVGRMSYVTSASAHQDKEIISTAAGATTSSSVSNTNQVSQTWISSGDVMMKPVHTVRDKDVTTSITATKDTGRVAKKVEFCKTEVHFTPEPGKFHIVESDENKPSTVHLFRRRRRSSVDKEGTVQATPKVINDSNNPDCAVEEMEVTDDVIAKTKGEAGVNGLSGFGAELKMNLMSSRDASFTAGTTTTNERSVHRSMTSRDDGSSSSKKTAGVVLNQNEMQNGVRMDDDLGDETPTSTAFKSVEDERKKCLQKLFNSSERLGESSHLNSSRLSPMLFSDGRNNMEDEIENQSPPCHHRRLLSNYEDLKIQRYLKQLTTLNSSSIDNSTSKGLESNSEQVEKEKSGDSLFGDGEIFSQGRFDNMLYENGSFVPSATRKSLIEMNNRNRREDSKASLAAQNYSFENEYNYSDGDRYPLNFVTVDTTLSTLGSLPHVSSGEMNSLEDKDYWNSSNNLAFNPEEDNSMEPKERDFKQRVHIPLPMYSSAKKDLSPTMPSQSKNEDIGDLYGRKNLKPLVSQSRYSAFESTIRRNTKGEDNRDTGSGIIDYKVNATLPPTSFNLGSSGPVSRPLIKSIVTIGNFDKASLQEDRHFSLEPRLGGDHTWKNSAQLELMNYGHEENNSHSLTHHSIRNPRFGNTTTAYGSHLEPEWISKARNRENRITDWSIIGKQDKSRVDDTSYSSREPPWLQEIRSKNKPLLQDGVVGNRGVFNSADENTQGVVNVNKVWSSEDNKSLHSSARRNSTDGIDEMNASIGFISATANYSNSEQRRVRGKSETSLTVGTNRKSLKLVADAFMPPSPNSVVSTAAADKGTKIRNRSGNNRHHIESYSSNDIKEKEMSPETGKMAEIVIRNDEKKAKPPKPPQRSVSLTNNSGVLDGDENKKSPGVNVDKTSSNLTKGLSQDHKKQTMRKGTTKKGTKELDTETSITSASGVPIHRHPTVKVSKLPIRTSASVSVSKRTAGGTNEPKVTTTSSAARVKSNKLNGQYKLGSAKVNVSCRYS